MSPIRQIELPEDVKQIIRTITEAGYEAYAVGGCIRDSVLGRIPEDYDITTSAKPLQIKELFSHTIDTGIKHGTVTIMQMALVMKSRPTGLTENMRTVVIPERLFLLQI